MATPSSTAIPPTSFARAKTSASAEWSSGILQSRRRSSSFWTFTIFLLKDSLDHEGIPRRLFFPPVQDPSSTPGASHRVYPQKGEEAHFGQGVDACKLHEIFWPIQIRALFLPAMDASTRFFDPSPAPTFPRGKRPPVLPLSQKLFSPASAVPAPVPSPTPDTTLQHFSNRSRFVHTLHFVNSLMYRNPYAQGFIRGFGLSPRAPPLLPLLSPPLPYPPGSRRNRPNP